MSPELLQLPWHIQLGLALGYAGYLMANLGNRREHKTHDVVFGSLLFSLVATSTYAAVSGKYGLIGGTLAALVGTLTAGLCWRKWGCHWWKRLMRDLNVSHSDDTASAIGGLRLRTDTELTGVSILLRDGSWLSLDNTAEFTNAPYPAFTLGESGDVMMYVQSVCDAAGNTKKLSTTRDASFGDRLTYIPSDRIDRVNMRFRKVASRPSKEAASADPSPKAS